MGAFHHELLWAAAQLLAKRFFDLSTKWMSSPVRKWGCGVSPKYHLWCESGKLERRWSSRFPCATPEVEGFSSDRVTFRIQLNINDRSPLQKQPTALTRRLFLAKNPTTDLWTDSKCESDYRCCKCGVSEDCKCMEFIVAGWCRRKWLRFDRKGNLTFGDADCFG